MTSNVAASVRQRLLNLARAEGRPFDEVLQRFGLERFLYRLGQSEHSGQFVLKGALLLLAWESPVSRSTRDIDLLGHLDNSVDQVVSVVKAICQVPAGDDGLRFDVDSIAGERITQTAKYEGVRVKFNAYLGRARIRMQLDVGFGDVVVPGPAMIQLPSLLDFPPPQLQGYSRESSIAEKFEAMVDLGILNSRMKDFYDIWLLATHFDFAGDVLARAIGETFSRRGTPLDLSPVALGKDFVGDKQVQWRAFISRHQIEPPAATLQETIDLIASFLLPVVRALVDGEKFTRRWPAGGSWRT